MTTCRRPNPDGPPCAGPMSDDPNFKDLCISCAWTVFFRGQGWDKVECVECEIGRHCDKHPENDPDGCGCKHD